MRQTILYSSLYVRTYLYPPFMLSLKLSLSFTLVHKTAATAPPYPYGSLLIFSFSLSKKTLSVPLMALGGAGGMHCVTGSTMVSLPTSPIMENVSGFLVSL